MVERVEAPTGVEPVEGSGWVYFIRGGEGKNAKVKVGWTANDPRQRLRDLQVGSPVELYLLGAIPGSRADEKELHEEWGLARSRGEWFDLQPRMVELLLWRGEFLCPPIQRARDFRASHEAAA